MMDSKTFNAKVARSMDCTPRQAADMIDAFGRILRDSARTMTDVAIPSFGNFVVKKSDEEIVIDRASGKRLLLPPQITIEFQPAAMLRKKINNNE